MISVVKYIQAASFSDLQERIRWPSAGPPAGEMSPPAPIEVPSIQARTAISPSRSSPGGGKLPTTCGPKAATSFRPRSAGPPK